MNINLAQRMNTTIDKLDFGATLRGISARKARLRIFRAAVAQASVTCGRHYRPRWASYLLDNEFQAASERRLRACYLEGQPRVMPAELAEYWAAQIRWVSEEARRRHTPELVDVAGRFIRCLDSELCERTEQWKNLACAG